MPPMVPNTPRRYASSADDSYSLLDCRTHLLNKDTRFLAQGSTWRHIIIKPATSPFIIYRSQDWDTSEAVLPSI